MNEQIATLYASIGALEARLLRLPDGYDEALRRQDDARKTVKARKDEIQDAEMEELLIASHAKNNDDKPIYTNDVQRKAAAARALNASPVHQKRLAALQEAEATALNADLAVRKLDEEQRSWIAVKDLTVARVHLLVHGR